MPKIGLIETARYLKNVTDAALLIAGADVEGASPDVRTTLHRDLERALREAEEGGVANPYHRAVAIAEAIAELRAGGW